MSGAFTEHPDSWVWASTSPGSTWDGPLLRAGLVMPVAALGSPGAPLPLMLMLHPGGKRPGSGEQHPLCPARRPHAALQHPRSNHTPRQQEAPGEVSRPPQLVVQAAHLAAQVRTRGARRRLELELGLCSLSLPICRAPDLGAWWFPQQP